MKMPESIREPIAKAPFAHLTTLNSTGGPQVTVVWVGIEGEDFVVGHLHLPSYQKVKNIRRDPRVALSMLSDADERTARKKARARHTEHGTDGATAGWTNPPLRPRQPVRQLRIPTVTRQTRSGEQY